jgi:hypothetical protein
MKPRDNYEMEKDLESLISNEFWDDLKREEELKSAPAPDPFEDVL